MITNREDQEINLWREATDVPDAAVSELHARVAAQIARPRPPLWNGWKWLAPVAVALMALAIWFTPTKPAPTIATPQPALAVPPPPVDPIADPLPATPPLVTQRPKPASKPIPQPDPAPAEEIAWIRLETEDPNVVIMLVGGGQ